MNPQTSLHPAAISTTQRRVSEAVTQAMVSRHVCPCCSSTLLRHMRSGGIYWRCGSCYQEMPV